MIGGDGSKFMCFSLPVQRTGIFANNGLTDASRDYLDSCVGSLFRERTPNEAEILLNNMLTNLYLY